VQFAIGLRILHDFTLQITLCRARCVVSVRLLCGWSRWHRVELVYPWIGLDWVHLSEIRECN